MSISRETKNSLAFFQTLAQTGGFTLRAPGYQTIDALRTLDMKIGRGKDALAGCTPEQIKDQVHAFLFIQAAPLPRVSRGVRHYVKLRDESDENGVKLRGPEEAFEEFLINHVDPFLAELGPDGIAAAMEQIEQLDEVDAARVDAVPPPGQKRERPDPNS